MKLKEILICFSLLLTGIVGLSIGQVNTHKNENLNQETRTVEYTQIEFDENTFNEFNNHEIIQNSEGINIKAEKMFDSSLLNEFDLVSLDENSSKFIVSYEINYIAKEETVFLSATIVGDDDISIIDTIPGLFTVEFSNTQWYECFKGAWQTKDKRWDFSNYKIPTLVL